MASISELACTYAALILHDDDIDITADKIATLCKAANVTVESYWPPIFAKFFSSRKIGDIISNVGAGGGGGAAVVTAADAGAGAAGGAGGAGETAKEEEKEEEKEESEEDEDMGFSLFD